MNYAVNYVSLDVMLFLKLKDAYIKYPGTKWDLQTLKNLISKHDKVILHGLIPSSGSIIDPHLCDYIEEFSQFVKVTNQKWLSFHFDYKPRYMAIDFDLTIEKNISKIRNYFGEDIQILVENVPPVDNVQGWCLDPKVISTYCNKYDFGFILDIPHAIISSEFRRQDVKDYLNELPLGKVKEIHVSGCIRLPNGSFQDSHTICNSKVYDLLEYILYKTPNCEMISIEYSPEINSDFSSNQKKIEEYKFICIKQQFQLNRVKSIVKKVIKN